MKKLSFLITVLMNLCYMNLYSQTSYLLTFTGENINTSSVVSLDHVYALNLRSGENISTTDTFIYLYLSNGISELISDINNFSIYPSSRYIVNSESYFNIELPYRCNLFIKAFDINGKELCSQQHNLNRGIYTYGFKSALTGLYIIRAFNGSEIKSLKIYCHSSSNSRNSVINFVGNDNSYPYQIKKNRENMYYFTPGDQLQFVGFTPRFKNDTIIDSPTGNENYVFQFYNSSPSAPANPVPADGAIDQPVTSTLSWSASIDPEGDPVTYNVYFGTLDNPDLVINNLTDTFYTPVILDSSTCYYWRVVAKDDHDNFLSGNIWSLTTLFPPFSCGNKFLDIRDKQIYSSTKIGQQCWMDKNLAYLQSVNPSDEQSSVNPYYYVNGYEDTNVTLAKVTINFQTYGVLYNWAAAMNGKSSSNLNPSGVQGICPTGWHLPSDAEFKELINYLGGELIAGGKLKEEGTVHWEAPNTGADNSTRFTGLPGSGTDLGAGFTAVGKFGFFWSSTGSSGHAYFLRLDNNSSGVMNDNVYKQLAWSVRCLKD